MFCTKIKRWWKGRNGEETLEWSNNQYKTFRRPCFIVMTIHKRIDDQRIVIKQVNIDTMRRISMDHVGPVRDATLTTVSDLLLLIFTCYLVCWHVSSLWITFRWTRRRKCSQLFCDASMWTKDTNAICNRVIEWMSVHLATIKHKLFVYENTCQCLNKANTFYSPKISVKGKAKFKVTYLCKKWLRSDV